MDTKITIIDASCGAGKTSWAINYMDKQFNDRFIYITPFIDELNRVIKSSEREFIQPNEKLGKGSKTNHFLKLLEEGEDICSTHSLFRNLDEEVKDIIKEKNYILILDEVMDVVEQVKISKRDINLLLTNEIIKVDDDYKVQWIDEDYKGEFLKFKRMIKNGDTYLYNGAMILWTFPCEIFKAFKEVYILTYLFKGQIQCYYYDLNKLEYKYKSVTKEVTGWGELEEEEYKLIDYMPTDTTKFKNLINVYEGKLNRVGGDYFSLSSTWMSKSVEGQSMKRLKNNTVNYFKHIVNTKSDVNMWTTFEDYKTILQGKGYTKGFVPCNARSTNNFKHKQSLAYLCNRFYNPIMKNFFLDKGISIDEDTWALSEMIQWIFRSQIRDGKPINIYIPSSRMRELLLKWFD